MRCTRTLALFALGGLAIALLCYALRHSMAVRSSDLALHYTLVDYYTRSWMLPPAVVNPVMAGYAPFAHMIGGLGGRLIGSGFLAMHFTSLSFVFLIYVFLFLGMARSGLLATLASYTLFLFAIAKLRFTYSFHGYEIVGNFFYAQIAGDAAFLAGLWVLSGRERDKSEIATVPLLVFLFGWLFPLAQIKLAGGAVILWCFRLIERWRETRLFDWRLAGFIALLAALCAAAVLLHPTFRHFLWIAENNGRTKQVLPLVTLAGLGGFLLVTSAALSALAILRRIDLIRPAFLAVTGLATAIPLLGQASLYFGFGMASDYAVRKHAYALLTLLAATSIALLVEGLQRVLKPGFQFRLPAFAAGVLAIIASAYLTYSVVARYAEDRTAFLAYQREVRAHPELRQKAVSLNRDHPGEFNLSISMVDLDMPGDFYPLVPVILGKGDPKVKMTRLPSLALVSPKADIPAGCERSDAPLALAKLVAFDCK